MFFNTQYFKQTKNTFNLNYFVLLLLQFSRLSQILLRKQRLKKAYRTFKCRFIPVKAVNTKRVNSFEELVWTDGLELDLKLLSAKVTTIQILSGTLI